MVGNKYYIEIIEETSKGIDKIISREELRKEDLNYLKQAMIFLDLFLSTMKAMGDKNDI